MNTVEDRLRAALRETAGEVTPQSVPPLRLHAARRRRGMAGPAARRRWAAWLAPLAAAASVTAVVAASLAISTAFHGGHRAASGPAGPFAGLPPYYIVLAGQNPSPIVMQRQFAEVRATATGATLARVTPPRPYRTFTAAAGAGDGRTFVLAAGPWAVTYKDGGKLIRDTPAKFFLLRIGAGGHTTRLTALP
ncbi:MAG TPA: hypothetical protein VH642_06620, partial [Streptosporangiaceae bacterium]